MSESTAENSAVDTDFGSILARARKSQHFTVEDVSLQTRIPERTIEAIELNALESLPAPTFTQGYIRTYAKFLEISEQDVIDRYNTAVPHELAPPLKRRSNLPNETNSQTPVIRAVSLFLLVAGIAALIYVSIQYYSEKAGVMESELESRDIELGSSLDSPTGMQKLEIRQNARMTEDGELIVFKEGDVVENDDLTTDVADQSLSGQQTAEQQILNQNEATLNQAISSEPVTQKPNELSAVPKAEESMRPIHADAHNPIPAADKMEIIAEQGSWLEVRDASNARLFYNMVPKGGSKVFYGEAPFRITLGNASTTRVIVNDLDVDMVNFTRPNNTAVFSVSTRGDSLIFH